ncbi:MAG TPA: pyridoxal phosphate-dependent aminotransferase [Vicinamibacterales bacterium]|nr:pyridoxal phosphate-dependent aminotransferase [Vicinamibacterales bacterium]
MSDAMRLADRLDRVRASQTQQVLVAVERLRQQGVEVIDLGAGEPDFPTPDHVKIAAAAAIEDNFTKYTAGAGIIGLREAIATHYAERYGAAYDATGVVVTAGGKQALYNIAVALFGPGDEVITHVPGWPSIVEQVHLAGAEPVGVRTSAEEGFELRAESVLEALTPRTRGIVINSPANPTGAVMSETELHRLADGLGDRDVWVILDLCYEQLIYDDTPHNLPGVLRDRLGDRAVLVGSASKSYAMTGWRCGWLLAPVAVAEAANAVQSHSTSHATSITQHATLAALTGPQACVAAMRDEYRTRRDTLFDWMNSDARFQVVRPAGAFYLFPDVSELLSPDERRTSADLALALLNEAHVAVTPGEAFDAPGFIRVSYAASMEQLREAWTRIQQFLG